MSTAPTLPFGRSWKLEVLTGASQGQAKSITLTSSDFDPAALRMTFDIWQAGYQAFWYGDIVIYNCDGRNDPNDPHSPLTMATILQEGMFVVLIAGYKQNGHSGEIFRGRIFQAFVERENVTDWKLILHCIMGRPEIVKNLINFNMEGPISQADFAVEAARQAPSALSLKYLEGALSTKALPRGKTVFTDPWPFFEQIADDNQKIWWYDGDDVNLGGDNEPDPNAIVYTPKTGLIGTPQQVEQGVAIRVLLDARLRVKLHPIQIKLDMTDIIVEKQRIGQMPSILDQNGVYVIFGVRHIGDTRGNDWYTDVMGFTTVGGKLGFLAGSIQNIRAAAEQNLNGT